MTRLSQGPALPRRQLGARSTMRRSAATNDANVGSAAAAATVAAASQMSSWSIKKLKAFLRERGVRHDDCFDKQDLVERAQLHADSPPIESAASAAANGPRSADASGSSSTTSSSYSSRSTDSFSEFGELVCIPASEEQKGVIIFFHGFGDSARGFASQLPSLLQMKSLKYILPTASTMPGTGMRSWGLPGSMGISAAGSIERSQEYAHHLIREELARGTPSKSIFLGGFSQGGCVATRSALSFPDAPLGGCIAASTFLGGPSVPIATSNSRLPVLCCHGDADTVVPPSSAQELADNLRAQSVPVDLKIYPGMSHAYCPAEAADVSGFIQQRLLLSGGMQGLRDMSARDLKSLLVRCGASTAGCYDKADLLQRAEEVLG